MTGSPLVDADPGQPSARARRRRAVVAATAAGGVASLLAVLLGQAATLAASPPSSHARVPPAVAVLQVGTGPGPDTVASTAATTSAGGRR
jgi:hypothetical protein